MILIACKVQAAVKYLSVGINIRPFAGSGWLSFVILNEVKNLSIGIIIRPFAGSG